MKNKSNQFEILIKGSFNCYLYIILLLMFSFLRVSFKPDSAKVTHIPGFLMHGHGFFYSVLLTS